MILMTKNEMQVEMEYRCNERIGILCLESAPSTADMAMARADAEAWLKAFEEEQQNFGK